MQLHQRALQEKNEKYKRCPVGAGQDGGRGRAGRRKGEKSYQQPKVPKFAQRGYMYLEFGSYLHSDLQAVHYLIPGTDAVGHG